jgi:hypothetical protein
MGADALVHKATAKALRITADLWINKAEAKGLIYGAVLVPGLKDSQGDTISAEEIEQSAHRFLSEFAMQGRQHEGDAIPDLKPVESYIAPADMEFEDHDGNVREIPQGTWMMVSQADPNGVIFKDVKSGKLTGFSIQGFADAEAA